MINPYDWCEWRLLVTVRNRHGSYGYLLDRVSQEDFLEFYAEQWPEPRDQRLIEMHPEPLTEESYNLLEPNYPDSHKLE